MTTTSMPAAEGLTLAEFLSLVPECALACRALGATRAADAALEDHEEFLDDRAQAARDRGGPATVVTEKRERPVLQDADVVVDVDKLDWFARCFDNDRFRVAKKLGQARKDVPLVLWDSAHRFTRLDRDPFGRLLVGHSFGQCENWLTCKDALAILVQLVHGRVPWFPDSYRISKNTDETGSLRNQFLAFLGAWLRRKDRAWIIKPAAEARSRGIVVSKKLPVLLKAIHDHIQAGAVCVACRYVEKPLLLDGHKFDLRFVVALRSVDPLELFVYDYFVVRRAAVPYLQDDFEDSLQHLTVVQYLFRDPRLAGPLPKPIEEFPTTEAVIASMEARTGVSFEPVIASCHAVLLNIFTDACAGHRGEAGECIGLQHHDLVRAVYGLDILLEERDDGTVQPILLECNYKPDNRRLMQERPHFLDQTFDLLLPASRDAYDDDHQPGRESCGSLFPSKHGSFIRLTRSKVA